MDFSSEDYVRIYVNPSPTARTWGFFTRVLMDCMVKAADKAGVIWLPPELIADKFMAIASVLECPDVEWVAEHYPPIERHGASIAGNAYRGDQTLPFLFLPRYREAQYTKGTKDLNNARYTAKRQAIEQATSLKIITDDETDASTGGKA